MSSISINIESCRMLKSSRSIKYFTSTSFSVSMKVWNSLMMICSWAMFMFVSNCRERRRFVGGTVMPTLSSVWCTSTVIGHNPCFCRSILNEKDYVCILNLKSLRFKILKITSICMCAISFAWAKAIRASIWSLAWCVKKLLSLGSVGRPRANVAGLVAA